MNARAINLNLTRLIECANIIAWGYGVSEHFSYQRGTDLEYTLTLLPIVPFAVALFLLLRGPTSSEWLSIRMIHQAFALWRSLSRPFFSLACQTALGQSFALWP